MMTPNDRDRLPAIPDSVARVSFAPSKVSAGVPALRLPLDARGTNLHDIAQLDYTIRSLPEKERACYIEATGEVPDLVESESRPAAFIVRDRRDMRQAARRMALYWSLRKQIFGKKAFMPLAQTGEGALNRADLTALGSCVFSILPAKQDHRKVVCFDASKLVKADPRICLRLAFYMFSVAAERQELMEDGIVVLAIGSDHLGKKQKPGGKRKQIPFSVEPILDALPARISVIHLLRLVHPGPRATFAHEEMLHEMRQVFGKYVDEKGIIHVGNTKDELGEKLLPYGLVKDSLPKSLGGGFGYGRFVQWQELRTRFEWGLPAGANDQEALETYDFSKVKRLSELSEEDRKERKRRMNVVHSRRKRERERIEIEVLQEQCSDLQDEQQELLAEHDRLKDCKRRAMEILAEGQLSLLSSGNMANWQQG